MFWESDTNLQLQAKKECSPMEEGLVRDRISSGHTQELRHYLDGCEQTKNDREGSAE
jgi:hypothetical protein